MFLKMLLPLFKSLVLVEVLRASFQDGGVDFVLNRIGQQPASALEEEQHLFFFLELVMEAELQLSRPSTERGFGFAFFFVSWLPFNVFLHNLVVLHFY